MNSVRSMSERSPTSPKPRWLRPVLFALAVLFAAAAILYTTLWVLAKRSVPDVELGFDHSPFLVVTDVQQASPAEKAGLRPGDRILAVDGTALQGANSLYGLLYKPHKPGDTVHLTIARPGRPSPIVLTGVFRRRLIQPKETGWTESFAELLRDSYPLPFVAMGLVVLFLRLEDRRVWHLALLFAAFAPGPEGIPDNFAAVPAGLRPFAIAFQILVQGPLAPLFYWFFALFPVRSPLDRRFPWLKWVSLLSLPIGALSLASSALPGVQVAGLRLPALPNIFGKASQMQTIFVLWILVFIALGVVSLASNFFGTADPEARRKIRVIFWGTAIAFAPVLVIATSHFFVDYQDPGWLDVAVIIIMFLFPLSFAYAVVMHRVLEIPVLLKRSARYLFVQRGFTVILGLCIGVTLLSVSSTSYLRPLIEAARPVGIALGAVFGTMLLWGGAQLHKRVSVRIDRAFFRSAYDARLILEDLAEKTRTATDRCELAQLLEHHLKEALQPSSLVVYLQGSGDSLMAASDAAPKELGTIPAKLPILAQLARRGQPWEFPPASEGVAEKSGLEPLHPECLVPVMGRGGRMAGLLVLGPRLSEGPYSGEDKRLLASVASQAGVALENIEMAEKMAERMEAERRSAVEMQVAKEVQDRLLPQCAPVLRTLECAGRCIQTRSVGGDYFDFLDLAPGHLGLVLGDVSGKGISAALLMANLQASLRSRCVGPTGDIALRLSGVNEQLRKSSAEGYFATLFFADYDDVTRQLVFSNCGHNPPILLRADGAVERLTSTATVLGLFEQWQCSTQETTLHPGDLLAIFSDGVTEAMNDADSEFGEARFIATLREFRSFAPALLLTTVVSTVQGFTGGFQSDDLTLVIARAL